MLPFNDCAKGHYRKHHSGVINHAQSAGMVTHKRGADRRAARTRVEKIGRVKKSLHHALDARTIVV
jgi:hypothetical protein